MNLGCIFSYKMLFHLNRLNITLGISPRKLTD